MLLGGGREARLHYDDATFRLIAHGTFVRCAVTGSRIPLAELKYWSVERQEAYVDAHASLEAERRARGGTIG
ncbi:DUF2093 domain-containing protein [Sphingomicrobium aestuariivivum]|uniref:DUF2093 domain-containing protein n=1 Tax=Sphingomicrobium aestuariivivum TaxID=1582356 RepID=UPI001FD6AEBF|nr:DUF2093 domain-containing protein [Sphingomicrobium aestuariivivum]MCJ8190929.1 DUF2093 domain-containing protein [Sphingomicrobium aestuariivivum]